MDREHSWEEITIQKRKRRDSLIPEAWKLRSTYPPGSSVLNVPRTCGILTHTELSITSDYDAVDLVQRMKEGLLSCEAVTVAFCKRAAIAQQLTNCLTEIFFDLAIERAKHLDAERKTNPSESLGPLFGLPISLKDSLNLPGIDTTIGLTYFANKPVTETSSLSEILLELGAILYCKTNVPQSMMTVDSDNYILAGQSTRLIRNSLLADQAVVKGLLSLCGAVSWARKRSPVHPGFLGHAPSVGPMATSARACRYFLEVVMKAEPWRRDGNCYRLPWQPGTEDISLRRLRIGVVARDGKFSVTPPMRRALQESSEKLSQAGHTVIPIELPDVAGLERSFMGSFALDGNEVSLAVFACRVLVYPSSNPLPFQYLKELLAATREPPVPSVKAIGILDGQPMPLKDILDINASRAYYLQLYNDLWGTHNLDLIMLPPAPHTAIPHDAWQSIVYTGIWNFVDCPAMVLPVGAVDERDVLDDRSQFGELDEAYYSLYTGPEKYRGMPISVQLVAQRYNDQGLAMMAEHVDRILNGGEYSLS
ncbi:unnamed protein product [Penicillium egyptiacum]|uniref:Amidase domain-containing protein n=1 Tax=Penicillium egyptiacum TaxID=1303716 RepID=A0A9W4K996_9EURO|nr:unnamed protein product [Penicillium egyptiacum]